ncbi:MAG: AAA family ATPase, partial [Synergistaceae bacterium]|nr:AAA family ATPase [Synergistaceae bacterium]
MWDGQVKVITGIRRCGKSYLLRTLFKNHLLSRGVREERILSGRQHLLFWKEQDVKQNL